MAKKFKTDAQKDAELGAVRGRTDSAASRTESGIITAVQKAQQIELDRALEGYDPSKVVDPAKAAIAAETTKLKTSVDEAITKAADDLDTIIAQAEADILEAERLAAEAKSSAELAEKYEAEGDKIIRDAVASGQFNYMELNPIFKGVINQQPQYADEASAALSAAMSILSSVGVEGLLGAVEEIRKLYPKISSEDALLLLKYDKRFNDPYLKRFEGNRIRMQKGLPPLDDVDYIADEQAYEKLFKTYNLNQFANRSYYATLIGDNQPPQDVSTKVSLAYDNIINGPKENLQALIKFFKINDIVAYALAPTTMAPIMKQNILAAQIGGVALQQGLGTSLEAATFTGAEAAPYSNVQRGTIGVKAMMQSGANEASARKAASYVAGVLPTAEKLSSIYAKGYKQYGQLEAEKEAYLLNAEAIAAGEAIKAREIAEFSGESGVLKSQRRATGGLY